MAVSSGVAMAKPPPNSFEDIPLPILACEQSQECTDVMKEISFDYLSAGNQLLINDLEAYSGECYHLSPLYDPIYRHHGAFAFQKKEEAWVGVGEFSFFTQANPHLGKTPAEVYQSVSKSGGELPVLKQETHTEVRFLEEEADLRYWFKSSLDKNEIYLVGQQQIQSYLGTIYCRFQKH